MKFFSTCRCLLLSRQSLTREENMRDSRASIGLYRPFTRPQHYTIPHITQLTPYRLVQTPSLLTRNGSVSPVVGCSTSPAPLLPCPSTTTIAPSNLRRSSSCSQTTRQAHLPLIFPIFSLRPRPLPGITRGGIDERDSFLSALLDKKFCTGAFDFFLLHFHSLILAYTDIYTSSVCFGTSCSYRRLYFFLTCRQSTNKSRLSTITMSTSSTLRAYIHD